MSEVITKSKSPRGLFEIHKKVKKRVKKKTKEPSFKNNEEQIMMELLRFSNKNENGMYQLLNFLETQKYPKNKRNKYKMYASEMKQNFTEIVNNLIFIINVLLCPLTSFIGENDQSFTSCEIFQCSDKKFKEMAKIWS